MQILTNRKAWITFFAVIGGVLVTLYLPLHSNWSPYSVELTQLIPVYQAVFTFLITVTLLSGLPWAIHAQARDFHPLVVGLGALLGAYLGFCLNALMGRGLAGCLICMGGLALIGGGLAVALELPSPSPFVRWLEVVGLPLAMAFIAGRVWGVSPFPTRGSMEALNAWGINNIGRPYQELYDLAITSKVIRGDVGLDLKGSPTFGTCSTNYKFSGVVSYNYLEIRGKRDNGNISRYVEHPYFSDAPSYQEIIWRTRNKMVFLTPAGEHDIQMLDLMRQAKEAFTLNQYDKVIRLIGQLQQSPAGYGKVPDIDFLSAAAKSYEFRKREKEAALFYAALASAYRQAPLRDLSQTKHYAEKALSLDPTNAHAKQQLTFNSNGK